MTTKSEPSHAMLVPNAVEGSFTPPPSAPCPLVTVTGLLHHADASPLTAATCFSCSHHPSQLVENTWREKAFYSIHAASRNHPKSLKTRLKLFPTRYKRTPFFEEEAKREQKAKVPAQAPSPSRSRHRHEVVPSQFIENTAQKITIYKGAPPQLLENKARKNGFYSRTPKVELYENKGQSAILLAPETRVFRLELRRELPAALRAVVNRTAKK